MTTRFEGPFFAVLLACAAPGCAGEDNGVVLPSAPSVGNAATVDPGLTNDCGDADRPVGRLRGLVYTLPAETRRLPDFQTLTAAGTICLDRLEVTERRGPPGFPGIRNRYEWFAVYLEGVFQVDHEGTFQFRLRSDDGAQLLVDGNLVINNEGYHAAHSAQGTVRLATGPHILAVPYWQGPGPMVLTLEVARPGEGYRVFRMDETLVGGTP